MKQTELAISTDFNGESLRLEDIKRTLERISRAGFTHIHWCHEWEGDYTYSRYEMQQIREWMENCHLRAKALHAAKGTVRPLPVRSGHYRRDFTSDWECSRKAGVELIRNRIELANTLGASEIVLHLHVPFISIQDGTLRKEEFYKNTEKSLDELQPYCKEAGVRICLENLFDLPPEMTEEQWDRLLDRYPAEFLGICFDAGHGEIVWGKQAPEIVRKYGERIYAVHLHDNYGGVDFHRLPGGGSIDWEELMKALAFSAYELPLVLEAGSCYEAEETYLRKAYETGVWLTKLYGKYKELQKGCSESHFVL